MSEGIKSTSMKDAGQAAVPGRTSRDEVETLRRERDEARELLASLVAGLKRASLRHGTYIDGLGAAMLAVERWSRPQRR